jgi:hypothetical protein
MPQIPDVQPVITEICYAPDASKGETEYVVISNVSNDDINLSGYSFTQGFTLTFPEGMMLPAGESLYIVKELGYIDAENSQVQWESGKLANEGETVELISSSGIIVDQVKYLPTAPWPVLDANNQNVIMLSDIMKANNIASNWIQKQNEVVDDIDNVFESDNVQNSSYDLLGRPVNAKSVHGVIIINGKKVLKK